MTYNKTSNSTENDRKNSERKFQVGNEHADLYLNTVVGVEIKENTAATYASQLRKYIDYLSGESKTVTTSTIKDVFDFYRAGARSGIAQGTLQTTHSAVKNLYRFIRIETDVAFSLDIYELEHIKIKSFNIQRDHPREPLTREELDKLIDAVNNRRNRMMVILAAETGARATSVRTLKLAQIDLDKDVINLENTKSGGFYPVPITARLALELERWLEIERDGFTSVPESEYVFPAQNSEKLKCRDQFYRAIRKAAQDAGIQEVIRERPLTDTERERCGMTGKTRKWWKVDIHVLRTTFSNLLQEAGSSDEERRAALDHSNVKTTIQHYTQTNTNYVESLREKLDQR